MEEEIILAHKLRGLSVMGQRHGDRSTKHHDHIVSIIRKHNEMHASDSSGSFIFRPGFQSMECCCPQRVGLSALADPI